MYGSEETERRANGLTFHLVAEEVWREQAGGAEYRPETFADEGFIHTTNTEEELLAAGNRYYAGDARPYLVLTVDLDHPGAGAIYDDERRLFPHLYQPMPVASVRLVRSARRAADGTFLGIDDAVD